MRERKTKYTLRFTSIKNKWKTVKTTAETHGISLTVYAQRKGVSDWIIETPHTLVDLCNFLNELGALGVQVTCSNAKT